MAMNRSMKVARAGEPVHSDAGRVVGHFEGGWLVKRGLDPERHALRKPPGWATDAAHLALLRERGGAGVRIHGTDGHTWQATLAAFDAHGFTIHRGFGEQIGLAMRWWS